MHSCINRRELRSACQSLEREAKTMSRDEARLKALEAIARAISRADERAALLRVLSYRIQHGIRTATADVEFMLYAYDDDEKLRQDVDDLAEALTYLRTSTAFRRERTRPA